MGVARPRKLSPDAPLTRVIDAWLFQLGATKPAPRTLAAYRSDVEGVARRIDSDGAGVLRIGDLTKPALRAGFGSLRLCHQAAAEGLGHRRGPMRRSKLPGDALHVALGGPERDEQGLADLPVVQACGHQSQDLPLAGGEGR